MRDHTNSIKTKQLEGFAPLQPIQIVRVNLTDENAAIQLSKRMETEEYNPSSLPQKLLLPPLHIGRFLLGPQCLLELYKTAQAYHIEDAHLRIIKHGLPWRDKGQVKMCFVPLHLTVGFRYQGMNIVGKSFISSLHGIGDVLPENLRSEPWAVNLKEVDTPLSSVERQMLLEYYMLSYLKGTATSTALTTIAIPSRPETVRSKSPTHLAFSQLAIAYPGTPNQVPTEEKRDVYTFVHSNAPEAIQQGQTLLSDPQLAQQSSALVNTWRANVSSQAYQDSLLQDDAVPGYQLLMLKQHYELLDWLRVAWRAVFSLVSLNGGKITSTNDQQALTLRVTNEQLTRQER